MSGIAGIFNFDGSPVDSALLGRLSEAMAHRGRDDQGVWVHGSVGLAHRMFWTTPEATLEKQPATHESGNLCLIMDGRVDNREELTSALQSRGIRLRSGTDVELVLGAYELWGEQCPERILGDFAFALWDGRRRRLFCARDILGLKPFYYHTNGRRFLFASELHQLFQDPSIPKRPNEGMVAEYLSTEVTSKEETLLEGILRLPPAHWLEVSNEGVRKVRYWTPDAQHQIRYRTDEEYAEHFYDVLKEAVRCRLRSYGPVGSLLSGGLDSSSLTVTAKAIYDEAGIREPGFETFSVVFPDLDCDESAWITETVRMAGLKSNLVHRAQVDGAYWIDQAKHYLDFPGYPTSEPLSLPVGTLTKSKGIRVLLDGFGGNEWLEGSRLHLADALRRLRLIRLVRQASDDAKILGGGSKPAALIFTYGLLPLVPPLLRRAARLVRRQEHRYPWILKQFAKRVDLDERIRRLDPRARLHGLTESAIYRDATTGWHVCAHEMSERHASWLGFEARHPLHDRRIAEFALGIPEEQRWGRDVTRVVMRNAMARRLPDVITERPVQTDLTPTVVDALKGVDEDMMGALASASRGWVDEGLAQNLYRELKSSQPDQARQRGLDLWALWMIIGIEFWLRGTIGGGSALECPPLPGRTETASTRPLQFENQERSVIM